MKRYASDILLDLSARVARLERLSNASPLEVFLGQATSSFSNAKVKKVRLRGGSFKVVIQHSLFHFTVKEEGSTLTALLKLKPFSTGNPIALLDALERLNSLVKSYGGSVEMPLTQMQGEASGLGLWGVFKSLLINRYGNSVGYYRRMQLGLKLDAVAVLFQAPSTDGIFVDPRAVGRIKSTSPDGLIKAISAVEKAALKLYQ